MTNVARLNFRSWVSQAHGMLRACIVSEERPPEVGLPFMKESVALLFRLCKLILNRDINRATLVLLQRELCVVLPVKNRGIYQPQCPSVFVKLFF